MAQWLDKISSRMNSSWLKLNLSKTEMMLEDRGKYFEESAVSFDERIHPQLVNSVHSLASARNQRVLLSSHINMLLSSPFARRLRSFAVVDDLPSVIHIFLIAQLSTAMWYTWARSLQTLETLTSTKHCSNIGNHEHTDPIFCSLHRFPKEFQIKFKKSQSLPSRCSMAWVQGM